MKYLFLSFLLISGCSYLVQTPTTTNEIYPRPKYAANIEVVDDDVLLDARPFFYYTSSHVAGAYHEDIKKYFEKKTTWPKNDLFSEARVLARKGVKPNSRVIVLGQGKNGKGEECRLAWTLLYMGINNVQITSDESIKSKRVTNTNPPLQEDIKYWEPAFNEALLLTPQELVTRIKSKVAFKVIDTRDEKTFLKVRHAWDAEVDSHVINIHWREFLTNDGRAKVSIGRRLESLGVSKSDKIVVLDDDSIGASCALMTLVDAGYKAVSLYAGGYIDLTKKLGN